MTAAPEEEAEVVICFHFSIFEPLETVNYSEYIAAYKLSFAFILVSLNHWKQYCTLRHRSACRCDLLSF